MGRTWPRPGAFTAMAVLAAVVGVSAQTAQKDTSIGIWTLNLAKSTFSPGPPPKSQTTTIEAWGNGGRKATTESVAADGSRAAYSSTQNYDGKDTPYASGSVGMPNGADTSAITRIDAYTTETTSKKAGKVVQVSRSVMSKDGKTRTTTTHGTNAAGQPTTNVAVYDRQQSPADSLRTPVDH